MKKTILSSAVTALAALALLAGCTGGGSGSSGLNAGDEVDTQSWVSDYNKGTQSITTAHVVTSQDATVLGEAMTLEGEGDMDLTDRSNIKMDLTVTMSGMEIRTIIVDGAYYMGYNGTFTLQESDALDLSALDPKIQEKQSQAITKVVYQGEEKIDGVATTHYSVTYDAAKMGEIVGAEIDDEELVYEIWVDAEFRPVRSSMTMTVGGSETSQTTTYSKFGEAVTIEAPEI